MLPYINIKKPILPSCYDGGSTTYVASNQPTLRPNLSLNN